VEREEDGWDMEVEFRGGGGLFSEDKVARNTKLPPGAGRGNMKEKEKQETKGNKILEREREKAK
jgi:hypothetical protein